MKTERVTISTPDGDFAAYVARPDGDGPAPAIVVLQEIFGINATMRDVSEGLAAQGYVAICPDLFWRIEPGIDITDKQMERAFELFGKFDVAKGMGDIQATIDFIRKDPQCTGKVGAVGFCLGGLLAYLTALRTDVDAAVGYYGVGIEKQLADAGSLKTPLMLHIAEEDGFVPKAAQAEVKAALGPLPNVEIHSYPGRDHAFTRKGGDHYHEADTVTARGRTLAFFKTHLA